MGTMTLQDLGTLVDYHYWARDHLLAAVERLSSEQFTRRIESSFPSVRETLVHLWGAESIWLSRLEGRSPTGVPDGQHLTDAQALRTEWRDLETRLRTVLQRAGEDGVQGVVLYHTFNGAPQAQPLWQILQHIVNHGTYHRGQITTMLRQLGAAPARSSELFAFYRETSTRT